MGVKWKPSGSKGVRYYEHPTRKHGVKRDRYYSIRYMVDGKQIEEGLGWASEGWTEDKAVNQRAVLKENRRRGEGPRTLAEKRALDDAERQERTEQAEQEALDRLTFKELSEGDYKTHGKTRKTERSINAEKGYLNNWIYPVIGALPLS
ncbi:MAG TPA: site-specific integrase, partial [Thermodesulfobacteriota bacterium]